MSLRIFWKPAWLAVLFGVCLGNVPLESADPGRRFSIEVDLGEDLGQSFGSLLEVVDADGKVVAGAGFSDVYNTRFRSDRYTLQFFIRPGSGRDDYTLSRLPHPGLGTGVYLMDMDQQVFSWTSAVGDGLRLWDPQDKQWTVDPRPGNRSLASGDGQMRLAGEVLRFRRGGVSYQGRTILEGPEVGYYYNFYYAHGHLFFYHTHRTGQGGFTRILACPWKPGGEGPVNLQRALSVDAKYVGATPFAWGQYQSQVLTVSNYGGVYVFQEGRWRVLLEGDDQVSYQVYSMLNFHDRLYLAQYPTGHLFEYNGEKLTHRNDWPPRLPGVSTSAREAQTMAVYGGDLMVGVWPWAELWRYQHESDSWHSMGRMFSHPELTAQQTHPYEQDADRLKLVTNHWGQRITGMVVLGQDLVLSTSSKGTDLWKENYTFLTDRQRREYGAVLKLNRPGNIAGQIQWTGKPIRFDLDVTTSTIAIFQDGKQIAGGNHDLPLGRLNGKLTLRPGQGANGRLAGRVLSSELE